MAINLSAWQTRATASPGSAFTPRVKNPTGGQVLDPDNRCRTTLIARLRCLGERAAALLLTRWKALRRVTLCPWRIGAITPAALVLTQFEHQGRY